MEGSERGWVTAEGDLFALPIEVSSLGESLVEATNCLFSLAWLREGPSLVCLFFVCVNAKLSSCFMVK